MKEHYCEESIVQNLKDAGCDEATIEAFMSNLQAKNQIKANQLLQKYRKTILNDLHKYQKRIDCLDYLLYILQRSKNNNKNLEEQK